MRGERVGCWAGLLAKVDVKGKEEEGKIWEMGPLEVTKLAVREVA